METVCVFHAEQFLFVTPNLKDVYVCKGSRRGEGEGRGGGGLVGSELVFV